MTQRKLASPELNFETPAKTNGQHEVAVMMPLPKEAMRRMQAFQKQLDKQPVHVINEQIGGEKFNHLPISYVEHLLKKIFFGLYEIKIVSYQMIVNELVCHVRVRVFHPVCGIWLEYDGIGAIPVLQEAQTKVHEFIEKKKRKAIALNMPAAYAIGIKNACKKIGKIFGADLNRKHEDHYSEYNIPEEKQPLND